MVIVTLSLSQNARRIPFVHSYPFPCSNMAVKHISDVIALRVIKWQAGRHPAATNISFVTGECLKVAERKVEQLRKRGLVGGPPHHPILTLEGEKLLGNKDTPS